MHPPLANAPPLADVASLADVPPLPNVEHPANVNLHWQAALQCRETGHRQKYNSIQYSVSPRWRGLDTCMLLHKLGVNRANGRSQTCRIRML